MKRPNLMRWAGPAGMLGGLLAVLFPVGTILRRMQAAGTGRWGHAVLLVQLFSFVLAVLYLPGKDPSVQ